MILSSSDPAVAINLVLHWSDTFSRLDVPDGYGVVLRETTMAAHVHANPGDDLPERLQTLWSMGSLSIVTVPEADLGQVALCRHSMQIRIVPKMRVAPARAVFDESESVAEAKMYNKKAGSTSNRIGESCSSAAKGDAVRALDRASYQAWMKGISGAAPITVNGQQRTIKTRHVWKRYPPPPHTHTHTHALLMVVVVVVVVVGGDMGRGGFLEDTAGVLNSVSPQIGRTLLFPDEC